MRAGGSPAASPAGPPDGTPEARPDAARRPRILCLWEPEPPLRAHLEGALGDRIEWVWPARPDDEAELIAAARDGVDGLLGWRVGRALVEAAGPRLALAICPGAGVRQLREPFQDRPDIVVLNSHGNAEATAQHAVALLLALANRIALHDAWMRAGRWQTGDAEAKSWLLAGRTVGLVGLGHIGRRIARKLGGFEVSLEALTARPEAHREDAEALGLAALHGPAELDLLCERASVLIVALPHTEATAGRLGRAQLDRLGPAGLLVNVGRGAVLDEGALFEALSDRRLLGAALDVWWRYRAEGQGAGLGAAPHYPYDADRHPFHRLDNVVLSPHRAASPFDDLGRWADVIENLDRFARSGRRAAFTCRVDLARGY